jgi:hypothetical protein
MEHTFSHITEPVQIIVFIIITAPRGMLIHILAGKEL